MLLSGYVSAGIKQHQQFSVNKRNELAKTRSVVPGCRSQCDQFDSRAPLHWMGLACLMSHLDQYTNKSNHSYYPIFGFSVHLINQLSLSQSRQTIPEFWNL